MVNIRSYKEYWETMATRIAMLKDAYLVANEAQLKDVVNDISDYPVLVATVPSADPDSKDADNTGEVNTGLLFVLKKMAASDRTDDSYITYMEEMQAIMQEVKEQMTADFAGCDEPMMQKLQVNSFHQDPEYNYLGHDGWSLSFRFKTDGY